MSAPVDVLAVLDAEIERLTRLGVTPKMKPRYEALIPARAAVAELIAAISVYYGDHGCEYPDERLEAAIGRVGGAK